MTGGQQQRLHKKHTGRRVGPTSSHDVILEAARSGFSVHGFDGTTTRDIARAADVDSALIHHFFLSKEGLFLAAVQDAFAVPDLMPTVVDGSLERTGERLARAFITHWENPSIRLRLVGLMRSVPGFDGASAALRGYVSSQVLTPVTEALGYGKPALRASLVGSQLLGLAFMRYVLGSEPIVSMRPEQLVFCIAGTCQEYLTAHL